MPLVVLDASTPDDDAFTTDLTLVRYDRHVAWRGDAVQATVHR